jgi:phosphohistidine phosphatase
MKHLIIIRHGDAKRDDAALTDEQRPLAPLGRRQTAAATADFSTLRLQPDAVVSSPAKRALDTAEIWLEAMTVPAERLHINQDVYEAERVEMLHIVRQLDDAYNTVALVGHNPGVTGLLHHLVGRGVETMSTSAYAVIAIDVDRWSRIALRDSELVHYYVPPANDAKKSLGQRFKFWAR